MSENKNKRNLKSIGSKVKLAREAMNLTQEQFADKYGYPRTTIAKLEAGIRDFKSTEIITLAEQLNVSTDYLLGRSDIKNPDTNIRMICEHTGLKESTVSVLAKIQELSKNKEPKIAYHYGFLLEIINLLLEYEFENEFYFFNMITYYLTHDYISLDKKDRKHIKVQNKLTEDTVDISVDILSDMTLIEIQKILMSLKEQVKNGKGRININNIRAEIEAKLTVEEFLKSGDENK